MYQIGGDNGLPLVQDHDDSPPSLVGSDKSDDERPPLEDDPNELEDKIDNSASFRPLPFAMCTTTSPTTTLALHSPPEGIAGVGVPVSTGEAPEGVHVCVSGGETPEGVCMSVSPKEASVPSGEGVEGLKEPARLGGLAGGAFTTAQDSVKATTGGDVKGPVGFFIPGVSFTKGAYVGARLHLDSLYLGASDCGPTHQLTVLEDFLPYGLAPRFTAHSNSHETVAFLENVWFPRFRVPEEIRCDQRSEFANAPLIELSKRRGFRLSFAPSGYKDGNSLSERWQREVLASVRSLLLERQLPGSSWPEIHDEAIRRLNNRMSVQGRGSRHTTAALPGSLSCVHRFFPSAHPPRPSALRIYCVGGIVMYNRGASGGGDRSGQGHKCGPVWAPYRVVSVENKHFYEIVATNESLRPQRTTASPHQLRPAVRPVPSGIIRTQPNPQGATLAERAGWRDSTSLPSSADAALTLLQEQEAAAFVPLFGSDPMTESPPDTVTTPAPLPPADLPAVHATDPSLSSQPTHQPIPESAPLATPPLASPFPIMPAPLQPGTMVIGRSPEHSLLWVEEILSVLPSDGATEGDVQYEVHVWGSHQRCALSRRRWAPGYYSSGGGYVSHDKCASKRAAEIVELSHDQKEDQGWIDREVYIRTPISEVPRNVPRIPLLRVRTEKLQDDGTRKFKTRTVINGKQVPREGLSVATRLCPPEAVRIVLQIALDACKRRGVDLSLQKADVVQAYLQAPLPPDRPPLAAIPPSGHPDHGQFLWVLRKAVYGLSDAGKVFEDFLTSVLRSLGWEPTLFPGMWVLRSADGKLRALLATYCDDLLILGIGEDAVAIIDPLKDIVTCGDYTDLSEGRFVGVQFDVSTTGVFCYQLDYVASLVLPPDLACRQASPCRTDWVVFINNSPLIWKSRRQSRIARSTTRAEVLALEEGIDTALHFANCTAPFYSNIRVGIGCDAANVLSLLLSGTSSSAKRTLLPIIWEMQDKACVVPLQAATDLVEQHRIGIFKIPTDSNLSDLLTKALNLGALTRLMSPSPSLSPVFGSEIVSSLPPLALRDRPTMEKERRGDGEELTA
uniref:Integrase catalytic domain-containing protein n=1 Tax=Chromera velia CCMP2878 TaxID=1169474 RepID=A0A0G4IDK7_9ALVE|eukprot:Cvel_13326.t1-p1 / transcript=Cvel_13326.t1 / gene=Cvel_13326 / organism=Chromera_velia_CCMP2878 / gene_product=hypothetical protein / transcript_product=hypothetical protein / location=Cvel_scaffold904:57775-61908(-) / protein_length=1070 / sequence_SO=supercontig / SO=protein_coding / is_pseudo=false